MTILFRANAVAAETLPEIETEFVIFAEQPDGSGRRLEIQRSLTCDAQDARLGLDTYCLVSGDGASYYGGIESWQVSADKTSLVLAAEAAATLGIDREVSILTSLTSEQAKTLEDAVRKIVR
jgi:hypothetical protein